MKKYGIEFFSPWVGCWKLFGWYGSKKKRNEAIQTLRKYQHRNSTTLYRKIKQCI